MAREAPVLTFGFELEAILDPYRCTINSGENLAEISSDTLIENHFADQREIIVPDAAKEMILYLKREIGGKAVTDSSITVDDPTHFPFEFASTPLELTTDVLEKVKEVLTYVTSQGVYANDSCGFHFHFSYDGVTKFDLIWIKLFYLFDNRSEVFSTFKSTRGEIGLWSDQFANQGNIKARRNDFIHLAEQMQKPDVEFVRQFNAFLAQPYFSSKYTVFGIHDKYRTLEWRGPRGFLSGQQDIVRFIDLVRDFAEWLTFASYQGSIKAGTHKVKRKMLQKLFNRYAQPQFRHFGIDIAIAVDQADTDEARVFEMIDFFRDIDLESPHATNLRKIANRIRSRHPSAWALMEGRLAAERG